MLGYLFRWKLKKNIRLPKKTSMNLESNFGAGRNKKSDHYNLMKKNSQKFFRKK